MWLVHKCWCATLGEITYKKYVASWLMLYFMGVWHNNQLPTSVLHCIMRQCKCKSDRRFVRLTWFPGNRWRCLIRSLCTPILHVTALLILIYATFLKHLCEITMYPLWQHRPHGIQVHHTVAMCGKKPRWIKHPALAPKTTFVHVFRAAVDSGIPLHRHLWQRVRSHSPTSVFLAHRACQHDWRWKSHAARSTRALLVCV